MRHGGLSPEPYRSLNVSFGVGDADGNVRQNRDLISRCIEGNNPIFIRQVHKARVHIVTKENRPDPAAASDISMNGDGMVTGLPETFLGVKLADCQSVIMYDPVRSVVANVHAGWRGSIKNILGRTVQILAKNFGCLARHVHAGISPSLGPCCATFINYKKEIPENFWRYKDASDRFDFWAISRRQLYDEGVLDKNIVSSGICTRCNTDHFFSYRGEGVAGRFASVIGIRQRPNEYSDRT